MTEPTPNEALAQRIAKRLCKRPPCLGGCMCSMRAGERCPVCDPSTLDEVRVTAMVLEEIEAN